jgi:hypothetical protein
VPLKVKSEQSDENNEEQNEPEKLEEPEVFKTKI